MRSTFIEDESLPEVVIGVVGDQHASLCVYGLVHDTEARCLLDGGAERNCLSLEAWGRIPSDLRPTLRPPDARLRSVMGEHIPVKGMGSFPLVLGNATVVVDMLVADIPVDIILGMPFNNMARAVIDYDSRRLFLKSTGETLQCYAGDQKPAVASVRVAQTVTLDPSQEYDHCG